MDYVRGDQEEHPYVVGLNFGIEAKLSEFLWKELVWVSSVVSVSKTIVEDKSIDIKDFVVALPSDLINTNCSPFSYLICVNIN